MPEHATMDHGRQVHVVCQTAAMLLIGQAIDGQGQTTPGQHSYQMLWSERTDKTIECHRAEMTDDRAEFQTEPTMRRQQSIASHLRWHGAVAQEEVREHREHRFTRGALDTPDGETTQTDPSVMGVARQAPATTTGRAMGELKDKGHDEGKDTFEECLPIAKELEVGPPAANAGKFTVTALAEN